MKSILRQQKINKINIFKTLFKYNCDFRLQYKNLNVAAFVLTKINLIANDIKQDRLLSKILANFSLFL